MGDMTRFQPKCYHLSPQYADSFWGRYIYIYQGCGSLGLADGRLSFQSRRLGFDIPLAAIMGIGMGSFA
jgi:hypothetical protein